MGVIGCCIRCLLNPARRSTLQVVTFARKLGRVAMFDAVKLLSPTEIPRSSIFGIWQRAGIWSSGEVGARFAIG